MKHLSTGLCAVDDPTRGLKCKNECKRQTLWRKMYRWMCDCYACEKGDYNRNLNEDSFYKWVTYRLVQTFEKRFPGKKLILVMDNAPYHNIRADSYIDPSKSKRQGLFNDLILTAEVTDITVQRSGRDKTTNLMQVRHPKKGGKSEAPEERRQGCPLQKRDPGQINEHPEFQQGKLEQVSLHFGIAIATNWALVGGSNTQGSKQVSIRSHYQANTHPNARCILRRQRSQAQWTRNWRRNNARVLE